MPRFDTDRFSFRPVPFKIFAENVTLRINIICNKEAAQFADTILMHTSRILPARLGGRR
jgi:hypothetical protein